MRWGGGGGGGGGGSGVLEILLWKFFIWGLLFWLRLPTVGRLSLGFDVSGGRELLMAEGDWEKDGANQGACRARKALRKFARGQMHGLFGWKSLRLNCDARAVIGLAGGYKWGAKVLGGNLVLEGYIYMRTGRQTHQFGYL